MFNFQNRKPDRTHLLRAYLRTPPSRRPHLLHVDLVLPTTSLSVAARPAIGRRAASASTLSYRVTLWLTRLRDTVVDDYIHVTDWYTTLPMIVGVDSQDLRGDLTGLPTVDDVNLPISEVGVYFFGTWI